MNAKELAAKLDGSSYESLIFGLTLGSELSTAVKHNWLVVVFVDQNDKIEFTGAINYEIECYEGDTLYLNSDGFLENDCDYDCPYFRKLAKAASQISAFFCNEFFCHEYEYTWMVETDIPHETFEITDDGEPYCRGIVFSLADVK